MDPEIKAMQEITEALEGLEPEVVSRVLLWASQRYGIKTPPSSPGSNQNDNVVGPDNGISVFVEFHQLFDSSQRNSGLDNVLIAAYWFQVVNKEDFFEGYQLNKELKNMGIGSSNITRDLDSLAKRNPKQVMQIRKSGTSKQARKKYKLTTAGIQAAKELINNSE